MEIKLSGKAADVVKAQVESGIYTDEVAFISDIVLKYETYCKKKLEALNREIAIGLDQANRGNVSSLILMSSCKKSMKN